jgi:HD superfamily phosphohydrolase
MNDTGFGDDDGRPKWLEVGAFGATVAGLGITIFLGASEISKFLHAPKVSISYLGIFLTFFGLFFPAWKLHRYIRQISASEKKLRKEVDELKRNVANLRTQLSESEGAKTTIEGHVANRDATLADLRTKTASLEQQLKWKDLDGVKRTVMRAASLWGSGGSHASSRSAYEDDPVYLQMTLDRELCSILAQPIVQRLNHIRQLSFAYLKFRSATHSRLSHSLGACKNAELVMTKVFKEDVVYGKGGIEKISRTAAGEGTNGVDDQITLTESQKKYLVKLAKVTALLHDLGHGPLSHALDVHIGIRSRLPATVKPDQYYSRLYVEKLLRPVLADAGLDPNDVIALMQPNRWKQKLKPWFHFIGDLVDSSLDVDRMDYLARDAHMTGLSVGALNMHALIERIVPFKEEQDGAFRIELAFDRTAVEYIEQFVYARDVMYISCYEHPKKIAAEKMLGKAFQHFLDKNDGTPGPQIEDLALLTDHELVEMMLSNCGAQTVAYQMLELLMKGITYDLLTEIPIPLDPRTLGGENMFAGLPDKIQSWAWDASSSENELAYVETPDKWAKELAKKAMDDYPGKIITPDDIIIAVPSWSIVDKWRREARIRILVETPSPDEHDRSKATYEVKNVEKPEISPVVADFLYALMRVRLKLRVFVHPFMREEERRRVKKCVADYFGPHKAQRPTGLTNEE